MQSLTFDLTLFRLRQNVPFLLHGEGRRTATG
jgi:hypothetical protein